MTDSKSDIGQSPPSLTAAVDLTPPQGTSTPAVIPAPDANDAYSVLTQLDRLGLRPTSAAEWRSSLSPLLVGVDILFAGPGIPNRLGLFPMALDLARGNGAPVTLIFEHRTIDGARIILTEQDYPDHFARYLDPAPDKSVILARLPHGQIMGYAVIRSVSPDKPWIHYYHQLHKRDHDQPEKTIKGLGLAVIAYVLQGWGKNWLQEGPLTRIVDDIDSAVLSRMRARDYAGRRSPVPMGANDGSGSFPRSIPMQEAVFVDALFHEKWRALGTSPSLPTSLEEQQASIENQQEAPVGISQMIGLILNHIIIHDHCFYFELKDPLQLHFREWADRPAIRQGEQLITYLQLHQWVNILAAIMAYTLRGVPSSPDGKSPRVGLFVHQNSALQFAVNFAAKRAQLPHTLFDFFLPGRGLVDLLIANNYRLLFVDGPSFAKLRPLFTELRSHGIHLINIEHLFSLDSNDSTISALMERLPDHVDTLQDRHPPTGNVMLSSGTTGAAKLVERKTESTGEAQAKHRFGLERDDRHLVVGPLFHAAAFSWAKGHLNRGASLFFAPPYDLSRPDPKAILDEIEKRRITTTFLVPETIRLLYDYVMQSGRSFDPSSLRAVYVNSAPFPPAYKQMAVRLFGERVWEYYGTTETGLISVLEPAQLLLKAETVGRVVEGVTVIITREDGDLADLDEIGDIYVRSPMTAGKFLPTQDVGFLDSEGFLHLMARRVEVIRSQGQDVYPRQINFILKAIPGINDADCIGLPHPEWREQIIAAVVLRKSPDGAPAAPLTADQILRVLAGHIDARRLPRHIVFVEALPRNAQGKVDRRRLRELVREELGDQNPPQWVPGPSDGSAPIGGPPAHTEEVYPGYGGELAPPYEESAPAPPRSNTAARSTGSMRKDQNTSAAPLLITDDARDETRPGFTIISQPEPTIETVEATSVWSTHLHRFAPRVNLAPAVVRTRIPALKIIR